jgi:RNA polymerase sigma factor (sigma-70 family)
MEDTSIGLKGRTFPTTCWAEVLAAGRPDARGRDLLERLLITYWKPVLAYIQCAWRCDLETAKDLTQAFFAKLIDKQALSRIRQLGSFRGYLKRSIKHFLIDVRRSEEARRPGGRAIPIDEAEASAGGGESPDEAYEREWVGCVLNDAIRDLQEHLERDGKSLYREAFRLYCLEGGTETYRDVADRLGLKESDVRNYLSYCRSALRGLVRGRIREYTGDESEVEEELARILQS